MSVVIQKKICILGDFAVGKTSLVRRFVHNLFGDEYLSTIGVKITRKEMRLPERPPVNLLLWDLAGGEDFGGAQVSYLTGAVGALLVCDLTRSSTLPILESYGRRLAAVNSSVRLALLGNKADLAEQSQFSEAELAHMAQQFSAPWFLTSAKTGQNVEAAFVALTTAILE